MAQYTAADHVIRITFACPECRLSNVARIERARVGVDGRVRMMCMGCKGTGVVTLPQWTG